VKRMVIYLPGVPTLTCFGKEQKQCRCRCRVSGKQRRRRANSGGRFHYTNFFLKFFKNKTRLLFCLLGFLPLQNIDRILTIVVHHPPHLSNIIMMPLILQSYGHEGFDTSLIRKLQWHLLLFDVSLSLHIYRWVGTLPGSSILSVPASMVIRYLPTYLGGADSKIYIYLFFRYLPDQSRSNT